MNKKEAIAIISEKLTHQQIKINNQKLFNKKNSKETLQIIGMLLIFSSITVAIPLFFNICNLPPAIFLALLLNALALNGALFDNENIFKKEKNILKRVTNYPKKIKQALGVNFIGYNKLSLSDYEFLATHLDKETLIAISEHKITYQDLGLFIFDCNKKPDRILKESIDNHNYISKIEKDEKDFLLLSNKKEQKERFIDSLYISKH